MALFQTSCAGFKLTAVGVKVQKYHLQGLIPNRK